MVLTSSRIHWRPLQSHHAYWYLWPGLRAPPCFYFNDNIFTGPNFHQDRELSGWDSPEQKPPERQNEHSSRQGFRFTPESSTKTGIKLHLILEQHRIKTQSRVRCRRTGQVCWQDNLIRCSAGVADGERRTGLTERGGRDMEQTDSYDTSGNLLVFQNNQIN